MAITVGKLIEILNTLDSDVPVVIETDREQFYLKEKDVTVEEFYDHTGGHVKQFQTILIYTGDHM